MAEHVQVETPEAAAAGHELTASTEAHGGGEHHPAPSALGLGPTAWVALAMGLLILVMIWKKVPGMITGGLDSSIAEIKKQLEEAKVLRAEAEVLRKEYADKIANAEKDAAAMLEHARHEAEAIVAKAEADTTAVIARREKMAEDKIAAAERTAIADLQNKAAEAAASAARSIIADKHSASADKTLVDQAIASI
jgi:F-type H+-transporting ATPase subunit b